jgi:hypothetical protein
MVSSGKLQTCRHSSPLPCYRFPFYTAPTP